MRMIRGVVAIAVVATSLHASTAFTQTPQPAQQNPAPLAVGAVAPDFTLPAATRYGILRDPVHLSDLKGKTVVLAFFFKARTKG